MSIISPTTKRTKKTPKYNVNESTPTPNKKWFWAFILVALTFCIGIIMVEGYRPDEPFIVQQPDGSYELADWRKEKLDDDIRRIRRKPRRPTAQQYALKAAIDGWYPCYNCLDSAYIFLYKGEVWKYGKTIYNEATRYPAGLPATNLFYEIQFEGTEVACLVLERTKIYYYALLPENLKRAIPLIRPPGNKRDY